MYIIEKILGFASIFIGGLVWYLSYVFFSTIDILVTSFVTIVGLGSLFLLGTAIIYLGLKILSE